MINREQLNSIEYYSKDGTLYTDASFDYEFNVKTQELWDINDGFGDPEFVCRITDFEKFKEIINYED